MISTWYLLCFLSAAAVLIAFSNQYILKMQTTIAITSGAVVLSLVLILAIKLAGNETAQMLSDTFGQIDFTELLLNGMLGLLLFAGALEINLAAMRQQRWEITALVIFSTLASTFLIGWVGWYLLTICGVSIPLIYCLLFGALISPTDPIAVLAIIKKMQAPERISIQVEGESLFNDGVGLVLFKTLFAVAFSGVAPTVSGISELFFFEAGGGILFGFVLAYMGHFLILNSRDGNLRLLITFCIPTAGFATANLMDVSGALAMVVSGIFIGNVTRTQSAVKNHSDNVHHIQSFWHGIDGYLNSLLFLVIGLLIVTLPITKLEIFIGLAAIPLVLLARFISVGVPYSVFKKVRDYDKNAIKILTWGGLRGGLALAMAASIPRREFMINDVDLHSLMLVVTYIVVIFSIVIQGSTITPLIQASIDADKSGSAK